ncbi:MAG: hypothetical protein EHM21_02545, partial [Chloroflexi bacterium]
MKVSSPTRTQRLVQARLATLLTALVLVPLVITACAPQAQPAVKPAEKVALKLAVLPIIDALPFYVAQKQGYFADNNLDVTFIPAASAAERDQLIAAKQADGMIN